MNLSQLVGKVRAFEEERTIDRLREGPVPREEGAPLLAGPTCDRRIVLPPDVRGVVTEEPQVARETPEHRVGEPSGRRREGRGGVGVRHALG